MRIQLLTFPDCPHAYEARKALEQAIVKAGLAIMIEEVDTTSPSTPRILRGWGSPTILVNGRDAGGDVAPLGGGCRLYRQATGELTGTPPAAALDAALMEAIQARAV